jgi:nucleolar protein 56
MGFQVSLLHEASICLAGRRVHEQRSQRKRRIAQAIHAVDDMLKIANLLTERLTEWYNYFLDHPIHHKQVVREVQAWTIDGNHDLDKQEENAVKQIAVLLQSLNSVQSTVEAYVRNTMHRLAPNVSELVGETIAARLIAAAGGLDRLAEIPSGTIQVLGAEKALFRHIKEGTPPPKHGIIFQHEAINCAPRRLRGKIARALAANIAIAARADVFTGRYIVEELKDNFEKRVREIRE